MFLVTSFVLAKDWKKSKCLSKVNWSCDLCCICMMQDCGAVKKNYVEYIYNVEGVKETEQCVLWASSTTLTKKNTCIYVILQSDFGVQETNRLTWEGWSRKKTNL